MARTAVNGSVLSIATTYGAVKVMSAISNAAEAVATLEASHGVVENDILEMLSGWQRLDARIVRADSVATNDVTLEDISTTDTNKFPAGSGTGSVREITAWTTVGQILTIGQSGGEQQFLTYQYIEQDFQSQIPTSQTPVQITLETHDDITLAGQIAVKAANDGGIPVACRIVARDGKKFYMNGYWSIGALPIFESNNILRRTITISLVSEVVQYSA